MPSGFEAVWPWIQVGLEIWQRHAETSSIPITKEEAEATARAAYDENKNRIANEFRSKGLEPPE